MNKFISRPNSYQSKTSVDCKVSNLSEREINSIIKQSKELLFLYLSSYLNNEQLKEFKKGETTIISLGICTGMLNSINDELQSKVNEHLCILDTDTLNKFESDIHRDF